MFNVTSGGNAASLLHSEHIGGEILPWRDVLHEGPVPGEVTRRELREIRAGFFADQGWEDYESAKAFLHGRDLAVIWAAETDVALWFEADLYDQLQLLEALALLAEHGARPERIHVYQAESLVGRDRVALFGALMPLAAKSLQAATTAWKAFCSPEPAGLARFASSPIPGLPFLPEAISRLMAEYPWRGDGLSRTERTLLTAAGDGHAGRDVFREALDAEERPFLCGMTCRLTLSRLLSGSTPLLTGGEGDFASSRVALSPAGREVLEGAADWMELGGVGRWIGGVHLGGRPDWRYHSASKKIAPGRDQESSS